MVKARSVLVVEDDHEAAQMLTERLTEGGYTASMATSLSDARQQLVLHKPDVVLLDLMLPDGSGLELFADEKLRGNAEIVLMTGHASVDTSVQALRLGAADYLIKPVSPSLLLRVIQRTIENPGSRNAEPQSAESATTQTAAASGDKRSSKRKPGSQMRGDSPAMQNIFKQIKKVAPTSVSVLVVGESGTGKELVANQIHRESRRHGGPFLALNCGAISAQLIESELFGHEKGSFTGAIKQHKGIFEQADGGTLFLDEVTEMPMDLQVRLLRVLETGTFSRVGSSDPIYADVRILAATNRDPANAVDEGVLREDLYYRLNVFQISLPPLRERLEDIEALAEHILAQMSERENRQLTITPAALEQLRGYHWPGNVRELRNLLQRAAVLADGDCIEGWSDQDLNTAGRSRQTGADSAASVSIPIGTSITDAERLLIEATLAACDDNRKEAAMQLGISEKTLYSRLRSYKEDED